MNNEAGGLTFGSFGEWCEAPSSGTSIFDPVLCEIAYRWFCPHGGVVLDPFAGGSVRGIVASVLGLHYRGHELRGEQIDANRAQAAAICAHPMPIWVEGDSAETISAWDGGADFVFSCPPYGDLEKYSDDPRDLSAMAAADFDRTYARIIAASVAKMNADSFSCFVVGSYRDKNGAVRDLPGITVAAFEAAGARFYNDIVLVTAIGSLPVRVGRQWAVSRKIGKTHQNVMVFCKGNPRIAAAKCAKSFLEKG